MRRLIPTLLLLAAVSVPAEAGNITSITVVDGQWTVIAGGRTILFNETDIEGYPGNCTNRLRRWEDDVQSEFDDRIPRNTLDPDDPDGQSDPGLDWKFWDGPDLVERIVFVTIVQDTSKPGCLPSIQLTSADTSP